MAALLLALAWMLLTAAPAGALVFTSQFGSEGAGPGQFETPQGIAVGPSGDIYVADTGNDRIQQFDSSTNFKRAWGGFGDADGQLSGPQDVAVDIGGNVYVADTGHDRVQKFGPDGTFVTKWGTYGTGNGLFSGPTGVAADPSGNVYVVDAGNYRIQKFSGGGAYITQWGSHGTGAGQFGTLAGIGIDFSGDVYVADSGNNRIEKFDSNGAFITTWGSHGSGDGQFDTPFDVVVDSNGQVSVTDMNNHRIQLFTTSGAFAGQAGTLGSDLNQFRFPSGITVDGASNVLVADTLNHRIQISGPRTSITVKKVSTPHDPQPFDFTAGGGISPSSFTLADNGTGSSGFPSSQTFAVSAGSGYSVSETVPTGWDQLSATCSNGSPVSNISVASNENVVCTFQNHKRGKIVVVQSSQPQDPQAFTYTTGGGLSPSSFTLDDDGNNNDGISNTQVLDNVVPGSGYSVTQNTPAGWGAPSVTCSNGSSPSNINVAPGETVTCTFTNLKNNAGRIVVTKQAQPQATQVFDFTAGGGLSPTSFQLDDDGNNNDAISNSRTFIVNPGSGYSVDEPVVPNGWRLESASCSNGSPPSNISVAAGETVTCTFVDKALGPGYVRPRGASPLYASLVPSFKPCSSPTKNHGAPLGFPSCPPAQASSYLTVGTPDANGAAANAMGFVELAVRTPTPTSADVLLLSSMTDVRCVPATSAGVCNAANAADGPDYSGQLQVNTTIRITDLASGGPATVVDIPLPFQSACANTASTSLGGTCSVSTSFNAVVPGAVKRGERATWDIDQIQVFDGGAAGTAGAGDATLFLTQGVFVP